MKWDAETTFGETRKCSSKPSKLACPPHGDIARNAVRVPFGINVRLRRNPQTNRNIHSRKSLTNVFGAEMASEVWSRFTVHHTLTHRSGNVWASEEPRSQDSAPGSE